MDAMLREMSSSQLAEWEAFFLLEPWGYDVENFRAGLVCSTVANYSQKRLRDGVTTTPGDFMPKRETREKTAKELSEEISASFGAL